MLYLTIGIDTESDNQWVTDARLHPTYENIYALPRLDDLFRKCGVRPTYLVTYPVVTETRSATTIRQLADSGDCEIGAHHHVWETPPCDREEAEGLPYALQIPIDRFERQLANLTQAIDRATGTAPVSYRSGRYGFDAAHTAVLERAGYRIDTSVHPLLYETHKGGPDFVDAPLTPYFLVLRLCDAPGRQRTARSTDLGRPESVAPRLGRPRVRPRAGALSHQTRSATGTHRQDLLASTVILLPR